jgi:hypothetical protein
VCQGRITCDPEALLNSLTHYIRASTHHCMKTYSREHGNPSHWNHGVICCWRRSASHCGPFSRSNRTPCPLYGMDHRTCLTRLYRRIIQRPPVIESQQSSTQTHTHPSLPGSPSLFWENDSRSSGQEIPLLLWNPCSQEPSIGPCPESDEFRLFIFLLSCLGLQTWGVLTEVLYAVLSWPCVLRLRNINIVARCAPAAATVQFFRVNLLLTPTCHESWCPWQVINAIVLEDVGFIGRHLYNYNYNHHNHRSCCPSCLAALVLLSWSPAC